jgi:hypothetical protein
VTPAKRQAFNALNKIARRQYWAETATVALARKLANLDNAKVACEVYSLVDHPYELVDTYGRVVGNIRVGKDFRIDVNVWLVILSKGAISPGAARSCLQGEILISRGREREAKRKVLKKAGKSGAGQTLKAECSGLEIARRDLTWQ